MSEMQQSKEQVHTRPAAVAKDPKRLKIESKERPSLTQLLSRKSALKPQLPLSQTSKDSNVPVARLAAQQQATDAMKNTQHTHPTKSRGKTTEEGNVVFELSTKRRVTVRKWKAMKFVDIREFYDDNGKAKPGQKGISLSPDQWEKLYNFSDAILEAIQLVEEDQVGIDSLSDIPGCIPRPDGDVRAIALPLSTKRRITVRYFRKGVLIDLREFYDQDGMSKPGKKGISLSRDQWTALQDVADDITEAIDSL